MVTVVWGFCWVVIACFALIVGDLYYICFVICSMLLLVWFLLLKIWGFWDFGVIVSVDVGRFLFLN